MVMKNDTYSNIIRTIDDEDDVPDFSEESDEEVEFQPSQRKHKKKTDFDTGFQFVSTSAEYNKDPWNDLSKYVKRKAKSKTDDKIKEARSKLLKNGVEEDNIEEPKHIDEEIELSEDELQKDNIKNKEKKVLKAKKQSEPMEMEDFSEVSNVYDHNTTFYQMNLSRPLLKAIGDLNYVHPTPIQAATIPVALLGRDICGCAATGTGKTAAYVLPILERLLYRPVNSEMVTRVLILVPTRELGVQVYQVTKQLCQHTTIEIGLSVGGLDLKTQETVLRKNPDIVIATPGRLIDHLKNTPTFSLDSIEVLVLDEADRMLDEYFAEQMKEIVKQCAITRQTMLFSATMTSEVKDLAAVSLKNPVKVFVDNNRDVAFNLRQEFIRIRDNHEADRESILAALICRTFQDHCMVFVQTKKDAHRLHVLLGLLGIRVGELHGNLTQPQRLEALKKFKDEEVDVLLATDVAARGLDISGVKTVINFSMPSTVEHYIHRVGRTARAGRAGVSVSLATETDRKIVKEIIKKARNPVKTRVIPPNIIQKYKEKIEKIETELQSILQVEHEERLIAKEENRINRAKNILNGENGTERKREWFQTKKERNTEETKLKEKQKTVNKKDKMKKKKKEDEEDDTLNKVAFFQSRAAKKQHKPKKIKSVIDDVDRPIRGATKRKKSNFENDLFDVSKKGVKRMRYEATKVQKTRAASNNIKKKNKQNNKNKKVFKGGKSNKK